VPYPGTAPIDGEPVRSTAGRFYLESLLSGYKPNRFSWLAW
jgi:hypothetical protein